MKRPDRPLPKNDFDPDRRRKIQEKSARHQKIMAERKKFKRNQQPREPRRKDWTRATWDDDDSAAFERIMPLDEGERRAVGRTTLVREASQELQGQQEQDQGLQVGIDQEIDQDDMARVPGDGELLQGRVIEIASGLCRVVTCERTLLCSGRGVLYAQESGFTNAVAVGDLVLVRANGAGQGVVEQVLPRRSLLARPDVFYPHLQQIVVANADQLLVVASWREPIIWFELIDRYLIAAARNRLPAVICVNKIDLAESRAECERVLQTYRNLGIPYCFTSAQTGEGAAELRALLQNRTTVLAGLSGVGKSSLLSAVQPGLSLRVGVVSERRHEGRHTTTQATLLPLDDWTWVADTPGIREFGLSGLTRGQLVTYFPEMANAAAGCRYRDCRHLDDPGCAVQKAVASGSIAASRMHSYRLIYASLAA